MNERSELGVSDVRWEYAGSKAGVSDVICFADSYAICFANRYDLLSE